MSEFSISMDGSSRKVVRSSLGERFEKEGWPKVPAAMEWESKEKWKYIDTFCLRCKKSGLDLSKTIHSDEYDPECGGIVTVIYKAFNRNLVEDAKLIAQGLPLDFMNEHLAKRKVEEEIEKLRTDEAYLNSLRVKYKDFQNCKKD